MSKICTILLVTQIETTFVLETSLESHLLWHLCAVKGEGRPIDVHGRLLGTSQIYIILLVTQIQTTFVLETSLENQFLWHLCAVKGKGHRTDVLRDVRGTSFWRPQIAQKILSQ